MKLCVTKKENEAFDCGCTNLNKKIQK